MKKPTNFSRSLKNFKKLDMFSSDVSFRENRGDSFGSIFGACWSMVIMIVVLLYGTNKFFIMSDYADTQFNEYTEKNDLVREVVGQDELGLWFAFSAMESYPNFIFHDDIESYLSFTVSMWE